MKLQHLFYAGCIVSATLVGCGADDDDPEGSSAGRGGRGGSAGSAGKGGSSANGGASGKGGTTGKGGTGGSGADSGAGSAGEAGDGGTSGTGGSSTGDAGSGGEGAEPGCTDFATFVTGLVNDQTRNDNAPVQTEGITFCEDPQDPDAFDDLF